MMDTKRYDYIIIGGGIAGVTAAEAIRAADDGASIAIISREQHLPYSRVLLPAFIKGTVKREALFLRTLADFTKQRIDFYASREAMDINPERREVMLRDGTAFAFGKALIATGGRPKQWGSPETQRFVYRLQTLDDAERIIAALPGITAPAIVGSSFIGFEFVEILTALKKKPVLIAPDGNFFHGALDDVGAEIVRAALSKRGATIVRGRVADIAVKDGAAALTLDGGATIPADGVFVGVGIDRNAEISARAGAELGERGIKTNEYFETSLADIFAAGDVAEARDAVSGVYRVHGNWANAAAAGLGAGKRMAGKPAAPHAVPAYSITAAGLRITAVGEYGRDLDGISRSDAMFHEYERFFIRDGRIAGVFAINRPKSTGQYLRIVSGRADVSAYRDRLRDAAFDLAEIPA